MYAYQENKIFLGQNRIVTALSYNQENETFALGFQSGGIKMLKFEEKLNENNVNQLEIILNENLNDAHQEQIKTVSWNVEYDKLLSLDNEGLMVVWNENDDIYEEEMINQSEQDQIINAQWSQLGNYILIQFQSGQLVLGNVEGDRLWSSQIQINIQYIDWLENDQTIVLSDKKGELIAIDTLSSEIFAEYDVSQEQQNIKSDNKKQFKRNETEILGNYNDKKKSLNVKFFSGNNLQEDESRLVVAYESGELYLIYNLRECDMKKFAFGFDTIIKGIWSKEGDQFILQTITQGINAMYLLNSNGVIQTCFEVPNVNQIEFTRNIHKLVAIQDNMMLMMRIRQKYDYCYLQDKEVFIIYVQKKKNEGLLYFYDIQKQQHKKKIIKNFVSLIGNEQNFVALVQESENKKGFYEIYLINHKGAFLESIMLQRKPQYLAFKNNKIVIYFNGNILFWSFQDKNQIDQKIKCQNSKLYLMDLRDKQNIQEIFQQKNIILEEQEIFDNFIESIEITMSLLYLCNDKGFIRRFQLANFKEVTPIMLNVRPMKIFINQNESYLALIDFEKNLKIISIGEDKNQKEIFLEQQVWGFFWGQNENDFFYIKRDKIYQQNILNLNQEEIIENGMKTDLYFIGVTFPNMILFNIDQFVSFAKNNQDEELRNIDLGRKVMLQFVQEIQDQIMNQKEITFDKIKIKQKNLSDEMIKFIGDQFLMEGNYEEAEKVYRLNQNYGALKFIQKLKNGVQNEYFKQGEKLIFLNKLDKAVELLINNNKENILIQLLKDYQITKELIKYEHLLDKKALTEIYNTLGYEYYNKGKFQKAIKYFEKSNNISQLIELYCINKDFQKLSQLCENEKNKDNIQKLAEKLLQFNLIELSAKLFERIMQGKKSVDIAILHNYWGTAVEISEKNNFQQIENVLSKFAGILLEKNQKMEAVQLYRKAKKNLEAAKMLNSIAEDFIKQNNSALLVKKIFVLSALEINLEKKKMFNPNLTSNLTNITLSDLTKNSTLKTLNTLITSDISSVADKILINPWKGAEAWHLYLMCLKYLKKDQNLQGLITCKKLHNFELELGKKRIYILGTIFSKRLGLLQEFAMNLQKLESYALEQKDDYLYEMIENYSIEIFQNQEPLDQILPEIQKLKCVGKSCENEISELDSYCNECGSNFGICMLSGRSILSRSYIKCKICKHKLLSDEVKIRNQKYCPLCHQKLELEKVKQ